MVVMRTLRRIRENRELTQEELAKRAGVTQNSLSKIETGERKPRDGTLEKLAKALGVKDPQMLAEEFPALMTFEEILSWPVERRQRYFEYERELGRLEASEKQLAEHYANNLGHFNEDPLVLSRLEVAYMYGYTKGYAEGRLGRNGNLKE
jgi:transcriptional regulator with XRE-family HTH domain